jgi:hypothetical protein
VSLDPLVVSRGSSALHLSVSVSGPRAAGLQSILVDIESIFSGRTGNVPRQRLLQNGQEATRVLLRDDGQAGDPVSGDGRFTSGSLTAVEENAPPVASMYLMHLTRLEYRFPEGSAIVALDSASRLRVVFYDVDVSRVPPVLGREAGDDARWSQHVVSMVLPRASPSFQSPDRSAAVLARAYHDRFAYEPAFLVAYQPEFMLPSPLSGVFVAAQNDVTGNGALVFDRTEEFGGAGVLQGVVAIAGGPSPTSHGLLIHELGHRWMAYIDPGLGISTGAHWGSFLDRAFNGFSGGKYNDFELYLMGLLPPDSVIPRRVGINGVTLDQVIERHGARTPVWPASPNRFTSVAMVIYHRLLTDFELSLFEYLASEFGQESPHPDRTDPELRLMTFFQATGGRARLVTRIPDDAAR